MLLAAVLFFASTFISTALSGSRINSLWGEIPGQDGYSAYTVASYAALFGVIVTHLKSPAQLGRLLGAVVLMGVLVGLYGIFQHYNHDFLNLTESTGGGSARVTIFMGNAIFAATVLTMTVPVTLIAATLHFQNGDLENWGPLSRISQLKAETINTVLWASILGVQLLGLMFTFSRGPWSGALLALAAFLVLTLISLGWRMVIRSGLVLGLAGILCVGFLHWQGNVSVVNVGPWLGFVIALLGLAGTVLVLFFIAKFGRAIVFIAAIGAVFVVVGVVVAAPSALTDRGSSGTVGADPGGDSASGQVGQRLSSIKSEILSGFIGGRTTHWTISWTLIKDRPWFEFDDLSLSWLRPVVGYGPDLFRYTYLLESPPDDFRFRPLEPDHAHNFFIHQTVELGFLGGFASLALFASVFGVTVHQLVFRRNSGSPIYRILLIGTAAVILGRFLEMSVGVARVSDLTVLWVIFGLLVASRRFDDGSESPASTPAPPPIQNVRRRNRSRGSSSSATREVGTGLILRLALVVWLIGPLGVITWQKSINSVRASVAEGKALEHFEARDLEKTLSELDKAIELAPGIPSYYNNRAQVFLVYQLRPDAFTEPTCSSQTVHPYQNCLGLESINSNLEAIDQQPLNYRARLAAGNSLFNLQLNQSAVEHYSAAVDMVPNSHSMRNTLAESQIDIGSFADALANLEHSLSITGDSDEAPIGLFLKGRALYELGRLDEAEEAWKRDIALIGGPRTASVTLDSLYQINVDRGVDLDIEHFDRQLLENPEDRAATYHRGLAHLALGNPQKAVDDFKRTRHIGLDLIEVRANLGYAELREGGDPGHLGAAIKEAPTNALFNAYLANVFFAQGNLTRALTSAGTASELDPDLGLAYLVRAKVMMSLGSRNSAKEALDNSPDPDLPSAIDYVERGQVYTDLGEYDKALSDLNEAIRINSGRASYYDARAKTYASMDDLESALEDFNTAVELEPSNFEYYMNRGVLYQIIGEFGHSKSDFELAETLSAGLQGISVPGLADRNVSYFRHYK